MATIENRIRDIRESKNMSQTDAANACELSFARYERIENGSPRTTDEEIKKVTAALRKCKKLDKKLAGRPFKDPAKQRAVEAARASGGSVAEILVTTTVAGTPAPAPTPTKKTATKAAPAEKKPAATKAARKSRAAKAAAPTAETPAPVVETAVAADADAEGAALI